MFFTHTPAGSFGRGPADRHPHNWTDAILGESTTHLAAHERCRIRRHYRTLRGAGFDPTDARQILWDTSIIAGARMADHDVWRR